MAVQFEFYKNPGTGEEGEEEQYHPRVVNFNSVSTEYLAAEIHRATTFVEWTGNLRKGIQWRDG
jgi:hypothetical protein